MEKKQQTTQIRLKLKKKLSFWVLVPFDLLTPLKLETTRARSNMVEKNADRNSIKKFWVLASF